MKHIKTLILLAVSLFLMQSCAKSDPDPINALVIDQDFEVFPSQKLGADGTEFYLSIRSTELDSCLNSILDAHMSIEGSKILVQINEIIEPEHCEEGLHLLEKEFLLPSGNMIYDVEFMKADFLNTSGKLSISEEGINLDIENLGGVFVVESQLNKIQHNYVWGYFIEDESLTTSENMIHFEEVSSEFLYYVPDNIDLGEGNYGHFEIDNVNNVIIPDVKESAYTMALEVPEEIYWSKIVGSLDEVTSLRPNLKFDFYFGNGESYSNL